MGRLQITEFVGMGVPRGRSELRKPGRLSTLAHNDFFWWPPNRMWLIFKTKRDIATYRREVARLLKAGAIPEYMSRAIDACGVWKWRDATGKQSGWALEL